MTGVAWNSTCVPVALNADAARLPSLEEPLPPCSGCSTGAVQHKIAAHAAQPAQHVLRDLFTVSALSFC